MDSNPTVSELRKTSDVTDDEITVAVDAVLALFNLRFGDWAPRFKSNTYELPSRSRL